MEQIPVFVQSENNSKNSVKIFIGQDLSMIKLLRQLKHLYSTDVFALYCNGSKISDISDIERDSTIVVSHRFQNSQKILSQNQKFENFEKVENIDIFLSGLSKSGKTALINRIVNNKFETNSNFYYAEYEKYLKFNHQKQCLKFHDVSGQACLQYYNQRQLKKGQIIVYCVGVDQLKTFTFKSINQFISQDIKKILVITKIDLMDLKNPENQQTSDFIKTMKKQCQKKGWILAQFSAKNNFNIEKFLKIFQEPFQNNSEKRKHFKKFKTEENLNDKKQNFMFNICLRKFPTFFQFNFKHFIKQL